MSAPITSSARAQHGIDLVGPGRSRTGWQARTEGAFDTTNFTIDWEGQVAHCPEGPNQHELARIPRQGDRRLPPCPVQRGQLQRLSVQNALHARTRPGPPVDAARARAAQRACGCTGAREHRTGPAPLCSAPGYRKHDLAKRAQLRAAARPLPRAGQDGPAKRGHRGGHQP